MCVRCVYIINRYLIHLADFSTLCWHSMNRKDKNVNARQILNAIRDMSSEERVEKEHI